MPEKVDVQLYKLTDVAVNDGLDGKRCWIVIRDIVYDVTDYLDDVRAPKPFLSKNFVI